MPEHEAKKELEIPKDSDKKIESEEKKEGDKPSDNPAQTQQPSRYFK